MIKTVTTLDGGVERLNLPAAVWTGNDEIGTGLYRQAIYIGVKSHRVIVQTDSRWETHGGGCAGVTYHEADREERAELADEYGGDVADKIDEIDTPAEL
jgi:hypothetical protein